MTAYFIDKMQAIATDPSPAAAQRPFTHMPNNLSASAIVCVLRSLNLQIPTSLTAAAAQGETLRASGHRFTVKEVDGALLKNNVSIGDRLRLKAAMSANGILEK